MLYFLVIFGISLLAHGHCWHGNVGVTVPDKNGDCEYCFNIVQSRVVQLPSADNLFLTCWRDMSCDGILVEVRSCVVCDVKEQSLVGDRLQAKRGGQGQTMKHV